MRLIESSNHSAGLVAMGGYMPAKSVAATKVDTLVEFLRTHTTLQEDYISPISETGNLPGTIETNHDGWESQPWYPAWLARLPESKKANPFQGAKERRRVPNDPESIKKALNPHPMLSSDAETLAGALALTNAGMAPEEIDLVLVSSLVPDRHVPLNASLVQHKLGLRNAGAYNVDTCCSSFVTMLELAMTYIRAGVKKNILIVGSSLDTHINDKSTYYSPYTGDAAIAGVVSREDDGFGYLTSQSMSQGHRHQAIIFQQREPALHVETSQGSNHSQEFVTFYDQSLCKEIAKHAQKDVARVVDEALSLAGYTRDDIDFLATHQPVAWAAHAWREDLGVDKAKFHETFELYGNIAAASVACNLLEATEAGKVKAGDKVMMVSSGVGENHIAVLHRVSEKLIKANRL